MIASPPSSLSGLPQYPRPNSYSPFPQQPAGTNPLTSFPGNAPNPVSGFLPQPGLQSAPAVPEPPTPPQPTLPVTPEAQSNPYSQWLTPQNITYGVLALGGSVALGLGLKSILKSKSGAVADTIKPGMHSSPANKEAGQASQSISQGSASKETAQQLSNQSVADSTNSAMPTQKPWNYKKTAMIIGGISVAALAGRFGLSRAGVNFTIPILDPLYEAGKNSGLSLLNRLSPYLKFNAADSARQFGESVKLLRDRNPVRSFLPKVYSEGALGGFMDRVMKYAKFENAYPGRFADMQKHLETLDFPKNITSWNATDFTGIRKMLNDFSKTFHPDKLSNFPDKVRLTANFTTLPDSVRSLMKNLSEQGGTYLNATKKGLSDFNLGKFKL